MKIIRDVPIINPFAVNDPFETVEDYSKAATNKPRVLLTTALAIRDFLRSGMPEKVTLDDSSHALRVLTAINKRAGGTLPLEVGDYEWLKKTLEEHGGRIFGISFRLVIDAINDLVL